MELARKLIHLGASLAAALVVWWLPPLQAATVLAAATAVALAIEVLRRANPRFGAAFQRALGGMMRTRESLRLTGATTLSVGYTLTAVLLPGLAAIAGILLTGVADAVAALVGRRFGSRRYPGGKSVEGSAAFLVVATAIFWILPGPGIGIALLMALLATLLEAPTLRVDDNLYLPLAGAAVFRVVASLTGVEGFS